MDQARVNRLRYRAWRRGFSEADLILGPFTDLHAPTFTDEQLDRYEALLDQDDHDLYDWIIDRRPTPAAFDDEIMAMLKAFRPSAHATAKAAGA
jgi:antitoxin CptB